MSVKTTLNYSPNFNKKKRVKNKIKFINDLSMCGFQKIETSSFVSPKWVPQLADAHEVFTKINKVKGVKYTALTPNERGFDNAVNAKVDEVAIFAAATETFSEKNINCNIETSLKRFIPIAKKALKEAHEVGDVDKIVDAQEALSQLSLER